MNLKPTNAARPNRILELDALRGFAALFVVSFHFGGQHFSFLRFGVSGVDLFFLISGFVILLTVEKANDARKFIVNRFSRLYPAYWVCVSLTAAVVLLNEPVTRNFLWQYLANLTMVQQLLKQPNIDDPYWTLIVELFFYAYIALLLRFKQIKNIEKISLIVLVFEFAYVILTPIPRFSLWGHRLANYLPIANHFPLFFAGMIFYQIRTNGSTPTRYLNLLLCYICQLLLFDWAGRSYLFLGLGYYAILLAGYFLAFYLFVNDKLKFIVNRVTLFFGGVSYVLYLLHWYIGIHFLIPLFAGFMNRGFAYAITLLLIILISALINRYIEIPAMRFIRRRPVSEPVAIELLQK